MACRNFDQLATACQQHWSAALDLLKQGYLGSFFGGMGRIDLAMAAQEAAKFPDLDRGLDQLLAKLPSQAVQPPKLQAEPSEINLGQLKVGDNRTTELHLTNLGMRLLYGTVTSDCKWLTLGDAPGHPEKMFQFGAEAIIPVQVRGQHLRGGTKPIEGHLIIDSNGGTIDGDVQGRRADHAVCRRPVRRRSHAAAGRRESEGEAEGSRPLFRERRRRQVVRRQRLGLSRARPDHVRHGRHPAILRVLGVAKAPKVEFSPKSLRIWPAASARRSRRPSKSPPPRKKSSMAGRPAIRPGSKSARRNCPARAASIPITIKIPKPCPPELEATLHVMGNGNQKLAVPLKVAVAGGKTGVNLAEEVVTLEVIEEETPYDAGGH